jgi:hypothetical protein
MNLSTCRKALFTLSLLCLIPMFPHADAQENLAPPSARQTLPVEEVVRLMVRRNIERAEALRGFESTRVYQLQYHGFPSSREAEMTVNVVYRAPDKKDFTVVSQTGSKIILDRVFTKLLEGEQEAMKAENRARTALNSENYNFAMVGYEADGPTWNYVLQVEPKVPSKFLYRGKVWIDAKDFAVSRIEVEPARSPSFWTKKSGIRHIYTKVDGFWLPQQNKSVSTIRLGGQATLTIDYKDYKIAEGSGTRLAQKEAAEDLSQAAR